MIILDLVCQYMTFVSLCTSVRLYPVPGGPFLSDREFAHKLRLKKELTMDESSGCFKLATCDAQTENQNITAYGILVSVSSLLC